MKRLGRYISRLLGRSLTFNLGILLPVCIRDIAISWHKNLSITKDEGDTYPYVKDEIGARADDVYYGQYLSSGTIDFGRAVDIDYTDPSDGSLVEGLNVPTGVLTIPVNGICDIGVYPREVTDSIEGVLDFDGVDDSVTLSEHPNVEGSKTISFYMYFKSYGTTQAEDIFVFGDNSLDYFDATYITNVERLRIAVAVSGGAIDYDISSIMNKVVLIEVIKTAGAIISTKADGVDLPIYTTGSGNLETSVSSIGYHPDVGAFKRLANAYVWGINIDGVFNASGQPNGNVDSSWDDSIGTITATVNGTPTTTHIDIPPTSIGDSEYTSLHPTCETAGTVLHDVVENSIHISVDTPAWSESLYGSDYLNQKGYVNKTDSDALGYDWNTLVDGSYVPLNINTLVPLAQWEYVNLQDSEGEFITDSEGEQLQVKQNL